MIWYGYHSIITKNIENWKILCEGLNGSNKYEIHIEDLAKLPKSHLILKLDYIRDNIYDRSNKLKTIVNRYFDTPLVADWKLSDDGMYVALSEKDCEVSLPDMDLKKLQLHIDNNDFQINNVKIKKPIKGISECVNQFIGVPYKVNSLQIEYVAKCAFIHVAFFNIYLRSQVGRINWLSLNEVGTIIIPSFDSNDEIKYNEAIINLMNELGNVSKPQKTWRPGHIKLTNNLWYTISSKIKYDYNYNFIKQKQNVNLFLEKLSPKIESLNISVWKYDNVVKVEKHIDEGLLPFEKINPLKNFNDFKTRIVVLEDNKVAVWSGKNYYIISIFTGNNDPEKIKNVFYDLWKYGYLLTDYGKYLHQDEFTYIPKHEIKSMLYLTYDDILMLGEKDFWKF
jgi:hypothetical protein